MLNTGFYCLKMKDKHEPLHVCPTLTWQLTNGP